MPRLSSALLLGGALLLASYINAPAAPTPAPAPIAPEALAAIDAMAPLAADAAQEVERLRARLSAVPEKPVARRDPFTFGAAKRPSRRAEAERPVEPSAPPVDESPVIEWPTLVALLTDHAAPAALTAVLAAGDSVEMLKAGDTIGGFQVTDVTATSVELRHIATSAVTRLSIR